MEEEFVLTDENYYSKEANKRYMSIHQFLGFIGYMGVHGCEAKSMAELNGEYSEPPTKAMLVGSYVDSYFEGSLDRFKAEHPEIFTQKGELKAEYKQAEKMIAKCTADDKFMKSMAGEKQRIMTASLFGCDWKIKMDSYQPGVAITDLKTTSDLHKAWRTEEGYVGVVEYWAYTLQAAIYQKVVEINTGEKLPFYFSFVVKEDEPELALVYVDQDTLDDSLAFIEENMPKVLAVKNGDVEPVRCGKCEYCKRTMKIKKPIHFTELIQAD